MAPHLAEEIHHFASGASADPAPDATGSGSFFQRPWNPVVSSARWKETDLRPDAISQDPVWCDPIVKAETESLIAVREEVMALLEQARTEKYGGLPRSKKFSN